MHKAGLKNRQATEVHHVSVQDQQYTQKLSLELNHLSKLGEDIEDREEPMYLLWLPVAHAATAVEIQTEHLLLPPKTISCTVSHHWYVFGVPVEEKVNFPQPFALFVEAERTCILQWGSDSRLEWWDETLGELLRYQQLPFTFRGPSKPNLQAHGTLVFVDSYDTDQLFVYDTMTEKILWEKCHVYYHSVDLDDQRVYLLLNDSLEVHDMKSGQVNTVCSWSLPPCTFGFHSALYSLRVDETSLYVSHGKHLLVYDKVSLTPRYQFFTWKAVRSLVSGPFLYLCCDSKVEVRNKYTGEKVHQWTLPTTQTIDSGCILTALGLSPHSRKLYVHMGGQVLSFQ
jgi:hypothetical protein